MGNRSLPMQVLVAKAFLEAQGHLGRPQDAAQMQSRLTLISPWWSTMGACSHYHGIELTILAFMSSVAAASGDGASTAGMGEEDDGDVWQDMLDGEKEDANDHEKDR